MVKDHEKDLREQLNTNRKIWRAIQNILESGKKSTHENSRMSVKKSDYRSLHNEVCQAVAWTLSVENKKRMEEENMNKMPHIKITTGNDCCSTEVFIDGKKVEGVRKVSFCKTAGTLPVLQLDLLATDMEIDAKVIPALPEIFQPFYIERNIDTHVSARNVNGERYQV